MDRATKVTLSDLYSSGEFAEAVHCVQQSRRLRGRSECLGMQLPRLAGSLVTVPPCPRCHCDLHLRLPSLDLGLNGPWNVKKRLDVEENFLSYEELSRLQGQILDGLFLEQP